MRKKLSSAIALLLCACLLCACGGPGIGDRLDRLSYGAASLLERLGGADTMPRFEDIEYVRPDLAEFEHKTQAVIDAIEAGVSFSKLTALLDECYEAYYDYDTMYSVADIRTCQDLTDSFYAGEYKWCSENYYLMQQYMEELFRVCANSVHGQRLERNYFWDGFCDEYAGDSQSYYYDEAIELMQQESELVSRYRSLTAAPTVELDGQIYDYNEYISGLEGDEYNRVMDLYYSQHNQEYADIYIELVDVRNRLAEELGYDSYEEFRFSYNFEREYSPRQAAAYYDDVKKYIVPVYKQVLASERYASVYYDYLGEEELFAVLQSATEAMGGDVAASFEFMSQHGLYDISQSSKKTAISFQTYLNNYDAPFLFLSPYADTEDILTFAHEFGHYVDAHINYNAYETIDLSECYSQAMEYLLLFYLDGALSQEEIENLFNMKMFDTVDLYVQQCSFAEFESIVYKLGADRLSAELLNDLSLQLSKDYGYYEEGWDNYYALTWIDIPHFFESPFYVVSYPVSNDIALQIYELEEERHGAGVEVLCAMIPRQYEGLMDTALSAGLESPFAPGRVQKIAEDVCRVFELDAKNT